MPDQYVELQPWKKYWVPRKNCQNFLSRNSQAEILELSCSSRNSTANREQIRWIILNFIRRLLVNIVTHSTYCTLRRNWGFFPPHCSVTISAKKKNSRNRLFQDSLFSICMALVGAPPLLSYINNFSKYGIINFAYEIFIFVRCIFAWLTGWKCVWGLFILHQRYLLVSLLV